MHKCSPQKIIKEIPDVQTVILPDSFFDDLSDNQSVFISLYNWMLQNDRVHSDNKETLHSRIYIGEKLYNKLRTAEKNQLSKKFKIKGAELEWSVSWSVGNSRPNTEIGGCKISGDVILVIPESSRQALRQFSSKISNEKQESIINKIRANAAGATFYQWLLSQIDRPDRIGKVASHAAVDKEYPRESNQYAEIELYLNSQGASFSTIERFKKTWLEYLQQYPDRIQAHAWCSECGLKIKFEEAFLAWTIDSSDDFLILDAKCLDRFNGMRIPVESVCFSQVAKSDFDHIAERDGLSIQASKRLEEKLVLWGITPTVSGKGGTSFIQSEHINQLSDNAQVPAAESKNIESFSISFPRYINQKLRYKVLHRDRFRCVICGRSPAKDLSIELHVDHILPWSKGGKTMEENLRTLCSDCNLGKGASIENP